MYEFMLLSLHLSRTTRPIKIKLVFNTLLPGLFAKNSVEAFFEWS